MRLLCPYEERNPSPLRLSRLHECMDAVCAAMQTLKLIRYGAKLVAATSKTNTGVYTRAKALDKSLGTTR